MITVFAKHGFTDTWDSYLLNWGGAKAHDFAVHTYEDLATLDEVPAGPIIFGGIERLTDVDRALAADVARVVSETSPDVPILNSPTATLRRYDLLTELHKEGLNPFRAYRITDTMTPEQFSVFLTYENDHRGPLTGLLHNQDELDTAIVRARIRQHDLRELIIIEYVDTRNGDERYMKYGAFKVGNAIVGRHANTGNDWVLKVSGSLKDPESVATNFTYVRDNPHVDQLRERFDVGGVGYGRIDYATLGESVVTWEINTNPTIMSNESDTDPLSVPRQELFVSQFRAAFDVLQPEPRRASPISLRDVSQELRVASQRSQPPRTPTVRRIVRKHKGWLNPGIRAIETAAIPFQHQILERWRRNNAS